MQRQSQLMARWLLKICGGFGNRYLGPNTGFFLSVAAIMGLRLAWNPTLILGAEIFAEMGSRYFSFALYESWYKNLIALDYGYLAVIPRLIALTVKLVWPYLPAAVPSVFGFLGLLVGAAISSLFCLRIFRPLVESDFSRFLISLGLGAVGDFETVVFFNVAVFGTVPIYLSIALSLSNSLPHSRWERLLLAAVMSILLLSKLLLVASAAPILFLCARSFISRYRHERLVWVPVALALCIQLATAAASAGGHGLFSDHYWPRVATLDRLGGLIIAYSGVAQLSATGIVRRGATHPEFSLLAVIFLAWIIFGLRRQGPRLPVLQLLGVSIVITSSLVTLYWLYFPIDSKQLINFSAYYSNSAFDLFSRRHLIGAAITAYFFWAVFIARRFKSPFAGALALVLWMGMSGVFGFRRPPATRESFPNRFYSDWRAFYPVITDRPNPYHCIPSNFYPWLWGYGCGYLIPPIRRPQFRLKDYRGAPIKRFSVPPPVSKKKLTYFGIAFSQPGIPASSRVKVWGPTGTLLSEGVLVAQRGENPVSFFRFPSPVTGATHILLDVPESRQVLVNTKTQEPLWVWLGQTPQKRARNRLLFGAE